MITANVPAAKKIVVHGPDSSMGGIPSQFPILEDTQFQQILTDSLEFFNIPENKINSYYLVDSKTGIFHNPNSFVRYKSLIFKIEFFFLFYLKKFFLTILLIIKN